MLYPPTAPGKRGIRILRFSSTAVRPGRAKDCAIAGPALRLRWRGSMAEVQIRENAPGDSPLLEKVRAEFEDNGCVAPGEGIELATRILENAPSPGGAIYGFLYGRLQRDGYVDLGPRMRLRMLSPILKAGVERMRSSDDLLGYETAYYALQNDPAGRGLAVSLDRVEDTVEGTAIRRPAPRRDYLRDLPPAHLRLISLTRVSRADHDTVLLAGRSRTLLEAMTRRLETEPDAKCDGTACVTIPSQVALAAEIRVEANGRELGLPVGGTVQDALREFEPFRASEAPKSLKIWRPYEGKLVPVEFDGGAKGILSLSLAGGEKLEW